MAEVDLIFTCFERTYRKVLDREFIRGVVRQNQFPFKRRVVVINNVLCKSDARSKAYELLQSKEIDAYYFVEDHIDKAYRITDLSADELGPINYYTDAFLVAAIIEGSDLFVHWDADIILERDCDWIGPSVALMESRQDIMVASPSPTWSVELVKPYDCVGQFKIIDGFSDQCFLTRRSEIARPIYRYFSVASLRYPHADVSLIFEARIDSYMRTHGRLRALFQDVIYKHEVTATPIDTEDLGERSRPESELLLRCARESLDASSRERIKQLCTERLNWNLLLKAADQHGLSPLLFWHLKSVCRDLAAPTQMQALTELFIGHAARYEACSTDLAELLDIFATSGTACIPFKGPVLDETIFSDPTFRCSDTMVIFVSGSESQTISLLEDHGYTPDLSAPGKATQLGLERSFRKNVHTRLNLRWKLLQESESAESEQLWKRTHTITFQGRNVTVFDDEVLLILLCEHAKSRRWTKLGAIVEIAQKLDTMPKTDWCAFLDLARELDKEQVVLQGIYLTRFLPNGTVIDELEQVIINRPELKRFGIEIIDRLMADPIKRLPDTVVRA